MRATGLCLATFVLAVLLVSLLLLPPRVFASYILPYPAYMPGNKLYSFSRIIDEVGRYWSFGALAECKHALHLSGKYLVEAKVLFEYGQYLLAIDALQRSNREFQRIETSIKAATQRGISTNIMNQVFLQAAARQSEVIASLQDQLPQSYVWQEEKGQPIYLEIGSELASAIEVRKIEALE